MRGVSVPRLFALERRGHKSKTAAAACVPSLSRLPSMTRARRAVPVPGDGALVRWRVRLTERRVP